MQLWLDADSAHPIGSGQISPDNSPFNVNVTIPASASPGPHALNAAVPGGRQARTTITVCAALGCAPVISMVDPSTGGLYPAAPPENWEVDHPATIRGANFVGGQTVTLYMDSAASPALASATVAGDGSFEISVNAPFVGAGDHNLIAQEGTRGLLTSQAVRRARLGARSGGPPRSATLPVFRPPPGGYPGFGGQTLQASLTVFIQALAQ